MSQVGCYIAYLNRGGPGTVCTTSATGGSCTQEWSPWPWLAVGAGFVVAGVMLQVRASRRRQHDQVPPTR